MTCRKRPWSACRLARKRTGRKWPTSRNCEKGWTRFRWARSSSASCGRFLSARISAGVRKHQEFRDTRPKQRAQPKVVEKTGRNRPWKSKNDFHFPTTATTTNLRLHFKWRDNTTYGYILRWLDAATPVNKAATYHFPERADRISLQHGNGLV